MRALALVAVLAALCLGGYVALSGRPPLGEPEAQSFAVVSSVEAAGAAGGGRRPPVLTRLRTETYAVDGATVDEVLRSLLERGPATEAGVFFGLTTAETRLRYRTLASDRGCAIADVEVDLDVTVTLPAWQPPPGVPSEVRRDWRRFLHALRGHEDEHREIAERKAGALHRAVSAVRAPTCEAAVAEGRRRVGRLQIEAEAAHRQFDRETDHGSTQGASWPVR